MFGGNRKTVSWKGDETAGAGAGGVEEVLEYQVEEGNSTRRKVEEIEMQKRRKKFEREEERQRKQEQFEEQLAKLRKWKQGIPEKKQDVTDDKFTFGVPGVRSQNYFPLWMTKQQEANVQMAKEKGRHTFGSPNLLFIQSKGRFVHYQK